MKRLFFTLFIISVVTLNGCAMLTEQRKQDIKDKIQALIEEYNTPENRDKLAEALQNALRSVQEKQRSENRKKLEASLHDAVKKMEEKQRTKDAK